MLTMGRNLNDLDNKMNGDKTTDHSVQLVHTCPRCFGINIGMYKHPINMPYCKDCNYKGASYRSKKVCIKDWNSRVEQSRKLEKVERKLCPFCGGKPSLYDISYPDSNCIDWEVKCRSCGSRGPRGRGHTEFDAMLKAIDLWNRRYNPDPTEAVDNQEPD